MIPEIGMVRSWGWIGIGACTRMGRGRGNNVGWGMLDASVLVLVAADQGRIGFGRG
jgi:hypothetical protein